MGKVSRRPSRATRPGRSDPEALPGWLQLINEIIQWLNREYPGWFEFLNVVRAARDELGGWPDWCLLPLTPSIYLFNQAYLTDNDLDSIDHFVLMNALFAWGHTKTVWHFDDELAHALEETTSLDAVPSELMFRLPGWAVATPIGEVVAITRLDYDSNPDRGSELQISVLSRDEDGLVHTPITIPLRYRTLGEGLRAFIADVEHIAQLHTTAALLNTNPEDLIKATGALAEQIVTQTVARLCYLLGEEPDISERVPPTPHRGRARQARLGTQPAQPIRELDVGFRVGAALLATRAAESSPFAMYDEPVGGPSQPKSTV
jgi:hypothetical protein